MEDIRDIQIDILTKTIAGLMKENAELRAGIMIMQSQKVKQEVQDGEHQDSSADE